MMIPHTRFNTIRTVIAALIIALAVHFTQSKDALVDITRPMVTGTLKMIGISAVDRNEVIAVGKLHVPWTRDCAGINLLLILLALGVWVNRQEKNPRLFWLRVLSMIPAALAANILRVLTLIAYRTWAYPGVESPQTHYFIGFIWLVPFITMITPKDHRPLSSSMMETLHAAAVISLLAPMAGTPNAVLISLAVVIALSNCRTGLDHLTARIWLTLLWMLAGAGIALINMESFWLPWLLTCPLVINFKWIRTLPGIICIACSHALLAMQPWAWGLAFLGLASAVAPWRFARSPALRIAPQYTNIRPSPTCRRTAPVWLKYGVFACLTWPFISSTLLSFGQEPWTPPVGIESRKINDSGFEIRLPGQPQHIGLACYAAASRDRHHTLKVCLKYRGIEATNTKESALVFTEGKHWFCEFFLQDNKLIPDYATYVKDTFHPWAKPGLHLIFAAPAHEFTPTEFFENCDRLAMQFQTMPLVSQEPKLANQP